MLIHNADITGSLLVNGTRFNTGSFSGSFTGAVAGTTATASYVEYNNVANKPALVSGSSQITYSGLTGIPSGIVSGSSQVTYSSLSSIPSGIVSGSSQVTYSGLTGIPSGIVSGSSQVTYSGLSGIPSGILSGSAQIAAFGYATTGSNGFNGNQNITGSLTVTGQVVAQTLNVQQVTSSIVFSSGSNIFGNSLANTQQLTGSVGVTGSFTVTTSGVELQVTNTGVNLGNTTADNHNVTGSLRVSGSLTMNGISTFTRLFSDITPANDASGVIYLREGNVGGADGFRYLSRTHNWLNHSGTSYMIINSSGNLGLGVTPSAWGSYTAYQVGQGAISNNNGGNVVNIHSNNYYDGSSFRYISNGEASMYQQAGGAHGWRIAPSGTAGNTISFTQAMTLDASGNLLVANASASSSGLRTIAVGNTVGGAVVVSDTDGGGTLEMQAAGGLTYLTTTTNHALTLGTNNSERMRITSGGNVGIGTASPTNSRLLVSGTHVSGNSIIGVLPVGNNTATIGVYNSSGARRGMFWSDTGFVRVESETDPIQIAPAGNIALTLATSGAATFASSVTATGGTEIPNGQFYRARRSSGNLLIDLLGIESGTDNTRLLITGDFNIRNGSLVTLLNMTTSGVLTVGRNDTGDSNPYSMSILRNGTTVSPGTWLSTPAINITDIAGDGPSSVSNTNAILQLNLPRVGDADTFANNAFFINCVNDNGSAFVVTGRRNVGILTNTPATALHVNGTALFSASSLSGNTQAGVYIVDQNIYSLNGGNARPLNIQAENLVFFTGTTYGERMRVNQFGQLLINATSSAYSSNLFGYNLGVRGNTNQAFISIAKSSQTLDTQGMIVGLDNTTAYMLVYDNIPLTIYTNGTEKLRVTSGGNVGIGVTSPSERLEVNGSLRLSDGNVDGPQLKLASSGFSDWNIDNLSGNLRAYYGSSEYLRLTSGGNLLIGTTSSNGTKLQVSGNAFISGFTSNVLTNHAEKFIPLGGPNSTFSFDLATEFPSLSIAGNVLGVTMLLTIFGSGGTVYTAIATIARNAGGSWASYALTTISSTASLLQSITGSGTTVTINTNSGSYVGVKVTAIVQ